LVRQHRGLIGSRVFIHEHDRATGRMDSLYDPTVALPDPYPESRDARNADPMLDGLRAPLTEAVLAVYQTLHWHPDGPPYQLVNEEAGRQWDFGQGFNRPQSFDALRQALALDPGLHVIIAHGVFDLVCPYYGTQMLLNQIPPASGGDRVRLLTYPGGHMFYSRDESRQALRAEAAKLIGDASP
jgi:carboxypeptidase C (cathepsin A)